MNALRSRLGPLPVWGWLLILTAIALGWWLYSKRRGASSGAAAAVPPEVVDTGQAATPVTEPGLTAAERRDLSEIPGIQRQLSDIDKDSDQKDIDRRPKKRDRDRGRDRDRKPDRDMAAAATPRESFGSPSTHLASPHPAKRAASPQRPPKARAAKRPARRAA